VYKKYRLIANYQHMLDSLMLSKRKRLLLIVRPKKEEIEQKADGPVSLRFGALCFVGEGAEFYCFGEYFAYWRVGYFG